LEIDLTGMNNSSVMAQKSTLKLVSYSSYVTAFLCGSAFAF
jgi:hypothetical protein